MSQWVLDHLQLSLRERMEAVDLVVHGPLLSSPTRAGYRRWLCDLYRFNAAFERSLLYTPTLARAFVRARLKSDRLSADVLNIGLTRPEYTRLAKRCAVPELRHALDGLGWLFIADRITLQLGRIHLRLLPELAGEVEAAGSFFNVYSGVEERRWLELAHAIERRIRSQEDVRRLELAATDALACLEATFQEPVRTSTTHAIARPHTDSRSPAPAMP